MNKTMKYVFIVGLPRTGTKLAKMVLQNSNDADIFLVPECWYFGDLFRFGLQKKISHIGSMKHDGNVADLVDYMYSDQCNKTYFSMLKKGLFDINKPRLLKEILASDRSDSSIYKLLISLPAKIKFKNSDKNSIIVGEKMPGNLYHIDTLMKWFPDAKIVHTFRDPRAILASELKRLNVNNKPSWFSSLFSSFYNALIVLYISVTWLYAVRLHRTYSRRYPYNYHLSKYEELVATPERKLGEICRFLNLDVNDSMLAPGRRGSSFTANSNSGFDKLAIDRWRDHLSYHLTLWMNIIVRKKLKTFGYKV